MTRSRRRQYIIANIFRKPVSILFSLVPSPCVRFLLGLFRWSGGFVGYGIRYICVARLTKHCGRKVLVFPGCILHWLERCEIGENVSIHDFCYIDAIGGVIIGDNTRVAHRCSFISGQHKYNQPGKTILESGYTKAPITIGNDVWLGTGVVILPGVTIGDGAIIGANSVVTKDIEPYSVAAGMPTRIIKKRFPEESLSSSSESQ